MNSTSGGLINLGIVWAIASATGFGAMAGLMILGDWTLMQALFAAAVIFFILGSLLSWVFLRPLPGPVKAGSATAPVVNTAAAPAAMPTPVAAPAPAAEPEPEPATAPEPAPAPVGEPARPAALDAPRAGGADDLKKIKGIGPKLEKLCNALGFYHFDQIAGWTAEEVAWVDQNLEGFKGRVTRDNWVEQAKLLAAGGAT
mgnify:CR=1 FL=1